MKILVFILLYITIIIFSMIFNLLYFYAVLIYYSVFNSVKSCELFFVGKGRVFLITFQNSSVYYIDENKFWN